jgi:hypothetical protein
VIKGLPGHSNSVTQKRAIRTLRVKADSQFYLFLQIDVLNIFNGMSQESLAQPPEFLDRIRSKELETRKLPSFFMNGPGQREEPLQMVGYSHGRGFGGIHDAHMRRRDAMQQRLE